VWQKREQAERDKLASQAKLWATRQRGHRVTCPACSSDAVVTGDSISAPQKTIKDDLITEKQEHLPSRFECIACGMKIAGLSQLTAAGLGDVYIQAQSYDAGEYYAPEDEEMDGYEPDNNEPS
jgi:transcription elongation factor Elf1